MSQAAPVDVEESWRQCLSFGHPQLDAATKLLTCPWVLELPLTTEQAQSGELENMFCSAVPFALHWAGGPGTVLTAFAVGVPAAACVGMLEECEIVEVGLVFPGQPPEEDAGERVQVGILFFEGGEIGRIQEVTPAESLLVSFDTLFPDGSPSVASLFAAVQSWGILSQPVTLTLEHVGDVPYIVRGLAGSSAVVEEEGYHSLAEVPSPLAIEQLRSGQAAALELPSPLQPPASGGRRVPGTPIVQAVPGPS
eukprot:2713857-Amphidinium_carterae.1